MSKNQREILLPSINVKSDAHHAELVYCSIDEDFPVCDYEQGGKRYGRDDNDEMDCVRCKMRMEFDEDSCPRCDEGDDDVDTDILYEEVGYQIYRGTCNVCNHVWFFSSEAQMIRKDRLKELVAKHEATKSRIAMIQASSLFSGLNLKANYCPNCGKDKICYPPHPLFPTMNLCLSCDTMFNYTGKALTDFTLPAQTLQHFRELKATAEMIEPWMRPLER